MALLSRFNFAEGSGSTAASEGGTYTLTTSAPSTAWAGGGGIVEQFSGVVAPSNGGSPYSTWSVAARFYLSGEPGGDDWVISLNDAGAVYLLMEGTNNFPSRILGFYSNATGTQWGSTRLTIGAEYRVVFAGDATSTEIYVNGVSYASLPGGLSFYFGAAGSPQRVLLPGRNGSFAPMRQIAFYDNKLDATGAAGVLQDAATDPGNSKMFFI